MARLNVLRTLAREYSRRQLEIVAIVPHPQLNEALRNALLDFDMPSIRFVRDPGTMRNMSTSLIDGTDMVVAYWDGAANDFNASTIGYAVRRKLGVPIYAQMDTRP